MPDSKEEESEQVVEELETETTPEEGEVASSEESAQSFAIDPQNLSVMLKERPYAIQMMQLQILYDIASILEDISETNAQHYSEFKATIPEGEVEPIALNVTAQVTHLRKQDYPTMPWISMTVFNDGPNPVFIGVPYRPVEAPLVMGEQLAINMVERKIKKVLLVCGPGNVAAVRIYALR